MKYEVVFSDSTSTTIDIDKQNGDSIYSGDDGIIYIYTKDILLFSAPVISVKYIKRICTEVDNRSEKGGFVMPCAPI